MHCRHDVYGKTNGSFERNEKMNGNHVDYIDQMNMQRVWLLTRFLFTIRLRVPVFNDFFGNFSQHGMSSPMK